MRRHLRIRLLAIAAVAVVAAAVWAAGDRQRAAADQSFFELRNAHGMRLSILEQSSHLAAYSNSADPAALRRYRDAGRRFEAALERSRAGTPAEEVEELAMLRGQETAARRWQRLADGVSFRVLDQGPRRIAGRAEQGLDSALRGFTEANSEFVEELDEERHANQDAAAGLTVALIVVLSALFGILAYVFFERSARREELRRRRHAGFTEVMQLARTEEEAYAIVKRHLERIVQGGLATVLNRNNSANRLEPATSVDDPQLAEALDGAEPEACIAVRSGRTHRRGATEELLCCEICGARPGNATCTPSLVGGEVIGSVLVEHERPLDGDDTAYLESTITEAAPTIANLRTLAVAELRAATDALTGLPNNRAVQETLRRMAAHAGRTGTPLAAVLFDLDRFKQVNDVLGHAKGDEVLAAVGDTALAAVRASDFVGRYGGEEFLALLPDTDREGALHVAEKLRAAIRQIDVPGVSRAISASVGVAVLPFDAVEPDQLLRVADRALYTAKANGRDRVETAPEDDSAEPALFSGEDG